MRRNLAIGVSVLAICMVGFVFLAPVFYFERWDGGFASAPVRFTAYRSLGCQLLGIGDEYYVGTAPFPHPMTGLVFTCVRPYGPNATSFG